MIDNHTTGGCMTVDGTRYCRDLKIVEGKVFSDWWRQEGHRLDRNDIEDILQQKPRIVVVGTGYAGQRRIPRSLQEGLAHEDIQLIAEITQEAVKTFNRLKRQGKSVAGAFHLTC